MHPYLFQSIRPGRSIRGWSAPGQLLAAALALAGTLNEVPVKAQTYNWGKPEGGLWSEAANWRELTAPPAGGGDSVALVLEGGGTGTLTNDLGSPFLLNRLTLAPWYGYVFGVPRTPVTWTVVNAPGNQLQFTGAGARLGIEGPGSVSFDADAILATNLTIAGGSHGHAYIGANFSGPGRLTILRGGGGQTILSGNNTHTGHTVLQAGILGLGSAGALGSGVLTNAGGSLRADVFVGPDGLQIPNPIHLTADLVWGGNNSAVLLGPITGSRSVRVEPNAGITLHLRGSNSFTGPVLAGQSPGGFGASVTIGGPEGSVLGAPALSVGRFGTLKIDNTLGNLADRVADTASITNHRGTLELTGSPEVMTTETVGVVYGGGTAFVQVRTGTNQSAMLTLGGLERLLGGVFLLRGSNLGAAEPGTPDTANLRLTDSAAASVVAQLVGGGGPAGTPTVSILPWAAAHNTIGGTGNSLTTYDPVRGFRPLDLETEYVASLVNDTVSAENVRLTNAVTDLDGVTEINALVLDRIASGVAPGSLSGKGTLRLGAGTLWNVGASGPAGTGTVSVAALDFGGREGVIWSPERLILTSRLIGTNGLTKAAGGELLLLGTNAVEGPLRILGGWITVDQLAKLGTPSELILNGGSVRWEQNTEGQWGVPVLIGGANGGFDVRQAGAQLRLEAPVRGAGFLVKDGPGTLVLAASNSFTGSLLINAGVVAISDPAQLAGAANVVLGPGGTLRNLAPLTLGKPVILQAGAGTRTIDARADLTLSAAVGHAGAPINALGFTKIGPGTLTLGGNNSFLGPLLVQEGRLVVNGSLAQINSSGDGLILTNGATLAGSGTIHRDVYLAAGTSLEVGASTLTINGRVTVAGNLELLVRGGAPVFHVRGPLVFHGGSVTVRLPGGSLPRAFTLFTAEEVTGELPGFVVDAGGNAALAALNYQVVRNGKRFDLVPSRYLYELVDLGTLGGPASFALDVNNRGQVTGNSRYTTANSRLHAFYWEPGLMLDLGWLPGVEFSRGYAINDAGFVVGESDNDISKAFGWTESTGIFNLGTLGGPSAVAHGLNDEGVVVGASSNGSAVRPFKRLPDGTWMDLGTLLGTPDSSGRAWAINRAGAVAGVSRNAANTTSQATLWMPGEPPRNLGSLLDGEQFSQAFALNDRLEVVGSSVRGKVSPTSTSDLYRPFYWHDGEMTELPLLAHAPEWIHGEAKAINNCGDIAGYVARLHNAPSFGGAAVLWREGEAYELNTLIPPGSGWQLLAAEGLNERGDIVGYGTYAGQTRAFLLRFTNEVLQGHVDLGAAYEEGELELHVHDEHSDTEFPPQEVILRVGPHARGAVPANPAYAFLGQPGAPVHILPAMENPNLLFLGLAAEEVPLGVFTDNQLRLTLLEAVGPGHFALFTLDALGKPTVLMNTRDGVDTNDVAILNASSHVHANWAFEAPGLYCLTLAVSGTTMINDAFVTLASEPVKVRFEVMPNEERLRLALQGDGTGLLTLFGTQRGLEYRLQTAEAVTGPWSDLGDPVVGTGGRITRTVPLAGPARYYRAVVSVRHQP